MKPANGLPHKTTQSADANWHKQRHYMLHNRLLELVEDFIYITKQPIDRITAQDLLVWSDKQCIKPSYREDSSDERHL